MKRLVVAAIYMALSLGAIPGDAGSNTATALQDGDMRKLIFLDTPEAVSDVAFELADGAGQGTLEAYRGKYVLLNFWATWCIPCLEEMPMLSKLQTAFGGDDFEVLTIATGSNSPAGIVRFLADAGIENLPRHQDPEQNLAAEMGVFGLPTTVIIDPEGREIARLIGNADWSSQSARAIIAELIGANS